MNMEKLVALSVKHNASDLHLCVGKVPVLRINGVLYPQMQLAEMQGDTLMAWSRKILTEEQQQQLQEYGHVDFVVEMPDKQRLRGNLFYQQCHISLVLRLIVDKCPTLEQLYAPDIIQRLILQEKSGLVLVTGATGSGKSTTLSAIINAFNNHGNKHIITLEDPIEFVHQSRNCLIQQRQVSRDVPDYQTALKGALRQDPDVILLGELRDKETIRLALTAAETGHLVLSTLHTRGAIQALDRLVDVFSAEEKGWICSQLAGSLKAVISQQLLPAREGGRVAIYEVLVVNQAVSHLIREGKNHQIATLMQTGAACGMQTHEQSRQQRELLGLLAVVPQ
ncbi:type IV pilus twitching motility protein PilT [Xenorhabdus bovienii]|uniref:Putative transport protein with P-loop containing NTP hydrolase domain n=1 Tax=Xenorhabdus bovienii str. kraussei Becker Underwood TaxID=1398204 RepID=A0A077Q059_XENBV|nr:PilT/PilU family type 4a pilus ATPase [Xenorhabdus bovienii]CDH26838.1 putative transport protein with P-loop containing NTP hydrolase domain [Xenorhabdus bovienii str. kraussei Becker Underwood]